MRRGCLVAGAAALVAVLAGLTVWTGPGGVGEAELRQRCADSRPSWLNYQEDIKGQIGATPVARWKGRLVSVTCHAESIEVVFRVSGAWAEYDAAVPILMKDPLGEIRRNRDYETDRDGTVRYDFAASEEIPPEGLPWLEFRYPHMQQRIPLSPEGRWHESDDIIRDASPIQEEQAR